MPGSAIPLEAAELTESTAVSLRCSLKTPSQWAGLYKISQNLRGNLHSLGVPRHLSSIDGREGQYQYADAASIPAVEAENAARGRLHLKFTNTLA